ncbi:ABC transporter substrate-binding protein [Anaerotalea alkaliphila]|uniref:ABC transporter substrate-binding protein n=1 Tax=Anaerotalea alkaliphila TaxID=2662126 RepID=A0A7X5HV88_9FIRM|nr:MqnA/MqnD/SBP family protein [Anaerotalea alkaliphila]NDL67290.1 ABC transporter substrate-binding protein [Anaerotalea alkaliphila]
MRKQLLKYLFLSALVLGLSACTRQAAPEQAPEQAKTPEAPVQVGTLKGPTGMGMAKLMGDEMAKEEGKTFEFQVAGAPDELVGKIVTGEIKIAALPTNLAASLYNKTEGQIQLVAVNTLGVLHLLEKGDTVHSLADIAGKHLHYSGQGSVPEYVLQHLLELEGLGVEKDYTVDFSLQHEELAAAMAAGEMDLAMLPQPHATTALMKNPELRVALDMNQAWEEATGTKLPMGCIVVDKAFSQEYPAVLEQFLQDYEASTDWVLANPEEAGILIEALDILGSAAVAAAAIPQSSIVYLDAGEAREDLEAFYRVLMDIQPKSIGGALPGDDFYHAD